MSTARRPSENLSHKQSLKPPTRSYIPDDDHTGNIAEPDVLFEDDQNTEDVESGAKEESDYFDSDVAPVAVPFWQQRRTQSAVAILVGIAVGLGLAFGLDDE